MPESCRHEDWADELLRVINKATNRDRRERQQTVEEFWVDLAPVRDIASDGEFSTVMASAVDSPQPHVSRGYTPIVPERPRFEPVSEKPFRRTPDLTLDRSGTVIPTYIPPVSLPAESRVMRDAVLMPDMPAKKKRKRFRRFAVFIVLICMFTGILYGTASFMRGRSFLPEIRNPFRTQTGVANTDIYLRPLPNTDNDPIGLVTKNSKVRIVNSQNNWYQVDVIEQGRDRPNQPNATRGWLNGKYLEIGDN